MHAHNALQFRIETFGCKIHTGVARGAVGAGAAPGREIKIWGLNLGGGVSCKCIRRGQEYIPRGGRELTIFIGQGRMRILEDAVSLGVFYIASTLTNDD